MRDKLSTHFFSAHPLNKKPCDVKKTMARDRRRAPRRQRWTFFFCCWKNATFTTKITPKVPRNTPQWAVMAPARTARSQVKPYCCTAQLQPIDCCTYVPYMCCLSDAYWKILERKRERERNRVTAFWRDDTEKKMESVGTPQVVSTACNNPLVFNTRWLWS